MSVQDPIGSTVPPEQPVHPTDGADPSLKAPQDSAPQDSAGSLWDFAKRNHVPAVLAVGGVAWLLVSLIRRSTERW